jgi:hypothetical protein
MGGRLQVRSAACQLSKDPENQLGATPSRERGEWALIAFACVARERSSSDISGDAHLSDGEISLGSISPVERSVPAARGLDLRCGPVKELDSMFGQGD